MLKKTIILLLSLMVWLFGIPTVYPIEAINPIESIKPIENTAIPKCVVHPMGEEYDLNLDGVVTIDDIMKVANDWNLKLYDTNYSHAYDFNNDNRVDIQDIMLIASKWGKSCYDLYPQKDEK
jgi:hypothetical protein